MSSPNKTETPQTPSNSPKKLITILDFQTSPTRHTHINSPRSLASINYLGLSIDKIIKISFDDFKKDPNLIGLPKETISERYKFIEKRRESNIKNIIEFRSELIKNEEIKSDKNIHSRTLSNFYNKNTIKSNNNNNNASYQHTNIAANNSNINTFNLKYNFTPNNNIYSKKDLEKMRKTSKQDLIEIVSSELIKEIRAKESFDKLKYMEIRKNQIDKDIKQSHNEWEEMRKQHLFLIKKENEQMEKLKLQREEEKREIERKRIIEKNERDKQKKKELTEKKEKNEIKTNEIHKKLELQEKKNYDDLVFKQDEHRMKELQNLEKVKKRNNELYDLTEKEKNAKLMLDEHNRKMNKEKELFNEKLLEKQINCEKNIQNINDKKVEKILKDKELLEQKQYTAKETLKKIDQDNMKKVEFNYLTKQKNINDNLMKIELKKMEENKQKNIEKNKKNEIYKKLVLQNEENEQRKIDKLYQKFERNDLNVRNLEYEKNKLLNIQRNDNFEQKYAMKERLIQIEKQRQNERDFIMYNIEEKNNRLKELQYNKLKVKEEKTNQKNGIIQEKENLKNELNRILSKKNFSLSTTNKIKELFPDNKQIEGLIDILRHPENKNKSCNTSNYSTIYGNNFRKMNHSQSVDGNLNAKNGSRKWNSFYNKKSKTILDNKNNESKRKLSMGKITELVDAYKAKLNKELLIFIEDEKRKEKAREMNFINTKNEKEKDKMESQFGKERMEASEKLIKRNKEIEKKVENYRNNLLFNNGYT